MTRSWPYHALVAVAVIAAASCSSKKSPTAAGSDPPVYDPGSVYVVSTPSGASILLDGAPTGQVTPDTLHGVVIGDHEIKVRLAHFADTSTSVHVNIASLSRVTLRLRYVQSYFPPAITLTRRTQEFFEGLGPPSVADVDRDGRLDLLVLSRNSHARAASLHTRARPIHRERPRQRARRSRRRRSRATPSPR